MLWAAGWRESLCPGALHTPWHGGVPDRGTGRSPRWEWAGVPQLSGAPPAPLPLPGASQWLPGPGGKGLNQTAVEAVPLRPTPGVCPQALQAGLKLGGCTYMWEGG